MIRSRTIPFFHGREDCKEFSQNYVLKTLESYLRARTNVLASGLLTGKCRINVYKLRACTCIHVIEVPWSSARKLRILLTIFADLGRA